MKELTTEQLWQNRIKLLLEKPNNIEKILNGGNNYAYSG